jgi:CubicO group peptidase (beta-lactamase class C family)
MNSPRLLLALVVVVCAAPLRAASDPLAGFDSWVEALRQEWKIPGLAISIVKDGQVIYAKGFGLRNVKQNLPATPDTLFAIGSNTKAFTATALALLVEEGKLDWDKPVREYIPSFQMWDEYVTAHLTPRDLVTHRSGLPRHDLLWYGGSLTRQEMFARLRYLQPSRGFRSTYQYQNLMFMTAGYLLEQITGQKWEEFIRRRFFQPLEMKTSNLSVRDLAGAADASLPYALEKNVVKEIPYRNIDEIGPAGSINSSVREMANWVILQMSKGQFQGRQVVPEARLRLTQTPQVVAPPAPVPYDELFHANYAMGWAITVYRGHLVHSHGGGIDGFISQVSLLPRDRIGVVILTNLGAPNPVPGIIEYQVYDRFLGLPPVDWNTRRKDEIAKNRATQEKNKAEMEAARKKDTKPSHAPADYAGKYEHPGYGTLIVEESAGQLKARFNGEESPLRHYHFDVFQATAERFNDMKFEFGLNAKGDVDRVAAAMQAGVADIVFRRAATPAAPRATPAR